MTCRLVPPLVNWVEKGKARKAIIGAHIEDEDVTRTRPLCPYPKVAEYKGRGSIDDAANFKCVDPDDDDHGCWRCNKKRKWRWRSDDD